MRSAWPCARVRMRQLLVLATAIALFACGSTAAAAPRADAAKVLKCGGKKVTKKGTNRANRLKGTRKADVIAGLGGNDTIRGLAGNDVVCGGGGNDRLFGNSGRDTLIGGRGRDTCRGGAGRDRIRSCEAGDGFRDAVYVPPTVTTSAGSAAWVEGAGPVPFDNGLTVSDLDSLTLQGAVVRIASNHVAGQDGLGFTNQLGITGTYDANTGVLALTGSASVADYQAALRSVTYENSSDTPSTATRTLTVQVTDQTSLPSNTGTRDTTLAGTNDRPSVTTSPGPLGFGEGDPPQVIDPAVSVADPDDASLEGATVGISDFQLPQNDSLEYADQNGISGTYDIGNGVLTLTGTASLADYQAALRSVRFDTNATTPASRTIRFTVNDGDADSALATKDVTIGPPNTAPFVDATDTNLAYTENDPPTVVDPGVTLTDPDSGQSSALVDITGNNDPSQDVLGFTDQNGISGSFDAANGELTLTGTASTADYQAALRSVTYQNTSDAPTNLTRTVSFETTDTHGAPSNEDARTIDITPVDDPPVPVDDSATVGEDDPATAVLVLANDSDADGGSPTIESATQPAHGTVVLTGGSPGAFTGLTYEPDPEYCNDAPLAGADTFGYTVTGGGSATVSMTVTCVNDAPVADDETFDGTNSAVGNTTLVVNDPDDGAQTVSGPKKSIAGDILSGDSDADGPGPLTITAGTFATNDGGSVTIESDGDFVFEPAAGTSCTDTSDFFDYTVSDEGSPEQTDTGRVTIAIAGCVWYVNNNAAGNSGTSGAPFDTLAQAETASGANHTIFVFDGDNTSTGYAAGINLKSGQRLLGEVEGLEVDSVELAAPVANAYPTLTANGDDVVDLDDGNLVGGFVLDPAGAGGGIAGSAGDTGGATIRDVNIADTGTAGTQAGLELNGTTGTFDVSNLTVTNQATGVLLNNAGTVNFASTSTISITTSGARGLDATGTSMGTSTFDDITVTGSGSGGVGMVNTTGTTTFGDGTGTDLALTTTSGAAPAFLLSNAGTVSVPSGGMANLSATGGPAVDVTATSGASLAFDDVDSTNSANDGINLDGLGAGTFSAASGDVNGAAGIAFDLNGGSGDVTYPGSLGNGTGATAEITGRSGGPVSLSGTIADTNDAGGGITMSGNTGGSTTFSAATKTLNTGASAAVTLSSNTGHTITLSGGGLDIDATTGAGMTGTGGGTLNVTGTGNTVDTTTGTALSVQNTTIGASGLTFQRVAANGAANGISLNNTGATGGLSITGAGSTAQGGDFSGGTIQSTTGHGVALTNTTSPSFRNMRLLNTGDSGVNGTQVNGFTFIDGTITGAGDASDENSITFDDSLTSTPNLTGAVTITNNVIDQTEAEGVDIENWGGTISNVNISGNALSDTGDVATPGSAVTLIANGLPASAASITKATVANNTITDFRAGVGVQVRGGNTNAGGPAGNAGTPGSLTDVIAVTGNLMNGGNGGVGNQPDRFFTGGVSGVGQGNFNVSNNGTAGNRLRNIDCIALEMQADAPATLTSTIQNNFINANSAVGCAGIAVGTDSLSGVGAATHTTTISGNNVMGTDGPGIFPIVRNSGSTMTAKVLNNTVAAPITTTAARAGIRVDSGSANGDTTLCLEISGNTTAGSTNSGTATTSPGINLRKQGTDPAINTFGIEGMAATASPGVENYVNGLNTSTSGTFGIGGTALLSAQSGFSNCNAP
jgi:hypothetical protein